NFRTLCWDSVAGPGGGACSGGLCCFFFLFGERDRLRCETRDMCRAVRPGTGGHARELCGGSREFGAAEFLTVDVESQVVGISVGKRDVAALHATVRSSLGARHHANVTLGRASEFGVEIDVLIALVEDQPAAFRSLRRRDDLSVFGAPVRVSDAAPA